MKRCLDCNCPISCNSKTNLRCRSCAQKAWRAGNIRLRPARQDRDVFDEEKAMHKDIREGSAALLAAIQLAYPERCLA